MFKLRCLLLSATIVIASAVHATGNGTIADEPAPASRVVTLNLYHDKDDWPQRRVRVLCYLQPDAIALQEVIQNEHTPNHRSRTRWTTSTPPPTMRPSSADDSNAVADPAELAALRADFRDSYGSRSCRQQHARPEPLSAEAHRSCFLPAQPFHACGCRYHPAPPRCREHPRIGSLRSACDFAVASQRRPAAIAHTRNTPARCDGV